MSDSRSASTALFLSTFAFAICFACWTINGVLITFLQTEGIFSWSKSQVGILIATPVLTGSLMRLPAGLLADRFGGRITYLILMLVSAASLCLMAFVNSFWGFLFSALCFGLSGASFAVGVAYVSSWFGKAQQGSVLGIFGMGNAGTALTLLFAPSLLRWLTDAGANPEGWRKLPLLYAAVLAATAVLFWFLTSTPATGPRVAKPLSQRLAPLASIRVWRFGAYYFLVFGGFVALSQWLVPYYVNAYELSLAQAGIFAAAFSLPASLFRGVGGWLSDKVGARTVLYWVFSICALLSFALFFPRMHVETPGEGILAQADGTIVNLTETTVVVRATKTGQEDVYQLPGRSDVSLGSTNSFQPLPRTVRRVMWAGKMVNEETGERRPYQVGDTIHRRELLARGVTTITFQANVHIFTGIVIVMGLAMGIGMAAVYKHIPTYFPGDVGAVGGLVGVIGGLGGFVGPLIFGALLQATGIWTTCWMFLFTVAVVCIVWMHVVVQRMMRREAPVLSQRIDDHRHPHPEASPT